MAAHYFALAYFLVGVVLHSNSGCEYRPAPIREMEVAMRNSCFLNREIEEVTMVRTAGELAAYLGARPAGDLSVEISGVASPECETYGLAAYREGQAEW